RERNVDIAVATTPAAWCFRVLRLGPHAILPGHGRDVGFIQGQLPDAPHTVFQHVAVVVHATPERGAEEGTGFTHFPAGAWLEEAKAASGRAAIIRDQYHGLRGPVVGNAALGFRTRTTHTRRDQSLAADVVAGEGCFLETIGGQGAGPAEGIGVVDVVAIGSADIGDAVRSR